MGTVSVVSDVLNASFSAVIVGIRDHVAQPSTLTISRCGSQITKLETHLLKEQDLKPY